MKRPILYVTLFFSAGIILSSQFSVPMICLITVSAAFIISACLFSRNNNISHISLYLAVLFFGWAYYMNSCVIPADHISRLLSGGPKRAFIRGVVTGDPAEGMNFYNQNKTTFLLRSEAVSEGEAWNKTCGYVRAVAYQDPGLLSFGDEVIVEGILSEPGSLKNPGVFDYAGYLRLRGILCVLKVDPPGSVKIIKPLKRFSVRAIAYGLRHKAGSLIDSNFNRRHAGFLNSIIIGDRAGLEEGIKEDFIKTGTVHVLAISGLHVGFVAAIFLGIGALCRIPKKVNLILSLVCLIFYTFATGANPPVVRAVVMFAIFAAGYILNRDSDPINTLSLAAFSILLYNPKALFNPSFQLSFASVASIMVFASPIMKALKLDRERGRSLPGKVRLYVMGGAAVSAAAWIGSCPLTAAYFNMVSPMSFIANLVIVPALLILTALSFAFLAVMPLLAQLGGILAFAIRLVDDAVFSLNHIMASAPLAYFRVPAPPVYFIALFYIAALTIFLPKKKYFVAAVLILCNIAVWSAVIPDTGKMEITFLDVGQGDSAYIKTPSGAGVLIDGSGGGEEGRPDLGRSVIAPYLWNKGIFKVDALVVTHFHEDHLGGMIYILNNFKVGCVIDGGQTEGLEAEGSALLNKYLKIVKEKKVRRVIVRRGDVIGPFGGASFYVLNPGPDITAADANDNSVVLKLVYGDFSALFCGDITQKAMEGMKDYGSFLKSDVIKVPHHGGKLGDAGKIKLFFNQVRAGTAIISVGRNNRYKAPSKNTTDVILSSGAKIYETKDSGALTILAGKNGRFRMKEFVQKN